MKAETKKHVAGAAIIGGTFVASAGVGFLAGTAIVKMVEAGWTGLKLAGGVTVATAGTFVACDAIAAVGTKALVATEKTYIEDKHEELVEAVLTAANSKAPKKGIWANGPKKSNAHLYV